MFLKARLAPVSTAFALVFCSLSVAPVYAADAIIRSFEGDFDDATFALESAIIDTGLTIDYVSHVGDMLDRTAADVGSDIKLFDAAQIFVFCSARVSRQVMEADPANLVHCPYTIYVAQSNGEVTLGTRHYPQASMAPVNDLLADILNRAQE